MRTIYGLSWSGGTSRLVHGDAQSPQRRMVHGLSDQEAATLGPLMRSLGTAAVADAAPSAST